VAGRIRVLSEETINRVAAGEVVERPAAALKELLENSVDAGASRLAVDLARAGTGLIRVADDGCGMSGDDVLLALERHATSKIAGVEDLARVGTLGFRGEALPSIAAVSRLRITTRARGEEGGTRVVVEGGRVLRVEPAGCPEGTEIEVRDLFLTVPARLKFLRTEATELAHCVGVVTRLALAEPRLGVVLRHGDRELLRLEPAGDLAARLRDLYGPEFLSGLVPVSGSAGTLAVAGFASRPGAGRPGAEYQQFFVNGRPVRDSLLLQGAKEACRDLFLQEPAGMAFFLRIALPPAEVDVNVHPTKREVRFRDLGRVRALLGEALRAALRADRTAWMRPAPPAASAPAPAVLEGGALPPSASGEGPPRAYERRSEAPALPLPAPAASAAPAPAAGGQLFGTYLVTLGPEGLVITDQHAAQERIVYERILARDGCAPSQLLLAPPLLELSPADAEALDTVLVDLRRVGLDVERFGPRSWRVRALPPELNPAEAEAFVREMVALVRQGEVAPRVEAFRVRAAAALACRSSVRAGRRLAPAEADALLRELARTENPAVCPHGRPTSITIDRAEIEKRFKRV
jgi:DNA mismatch repair protein MutL